jgi:hypothetical protein
MPRRGQTYTVTPEWQRDVRARLKAKGMTSKQLAKAVRAAPSTVSELLSPTARHSTLLPAIHRVLEWDPPPVPAAPSDDPIPIPSPDAVEMAAMFDRLPEAVRKKLLVDAKFYLGLAIPGSDDD